MDRVGYQPTFFDRTWWVATHPTRYTLVAGSTDWRWSSAQAYEQNDPPDALIDMPPV